MNQDPKKSAQSCGCDEGANYRCEQHQNADIEVVTNGLGERVHFHGKPVNVPPVGANATWKALATPVRHKGIFPDSAQGRKDHPVFTGVLMYFPDAIAAVARVSKMGNDQHNPGQPLHWAREKSADQTDTATRHLMDHGVGNIKDSDGMYHLAKAAWRVLAELQLTIEQEREGR